MYGIEGMTMLDAYSVVGALITAGIVTLFGMFAVYGEASLQYYKLKNRIGTRISKKRGGAV